MILKAEEISKSYRGRKVVNNISIEVNQGEIVGLLGPNGAGKTTSFYMIVGLIKADSGTITIDNNASLTLIINSNAIKTIILIGSTNSLWKLVPNATRIFETSLITIDESSPVFLLSKKDNDMDCK